MPWKDLDIEEVKASIFEIIQQKCRVYMPWSNTYCTCDIRRVGVFTLGLEFDEELEETLVLQISEQERRRRLRFIPRNPRRYNRVLAR